MFFLPLKINMQIFEIHFCQKIVKNAHFHSPEPKVTYSNRLFHLTNSLNPTISSPNIRHYKEKHQIFFEKLEPANVWLFFKTNDRNCQRQL